MKDEEIILDTLVKCLIIGDKIIYIYPTGFSSNVYISQIFEHFITIKDIFFWGEEVRIYKNQLKYSEEFGLYILDKPI